jgi:hypothetical protein
LLVVTVMALPGGIPETLAPASPYRETSPIRAFLKMET